MATLATLRTELALRLRDSSNDVFDVSELDSLINAGIDEVSTFYPREVVTTVATVASNVYTYDASDFANIYRIDLYASDGTYRATIPHGISDGPNSGWETHAGVLYLPPSWTLTAGDTIRAFGYATFTQLAASTQTTDLDVTATNAVLAYAQAEGYQRLIMDRALFQQWAADSNNTDVTALQLASLANQARGVWETQRRRRRLRKLG